MGSQYVQMACAFVLATLVYGGGVSVWHILALSFLAGTAQAFGGPGLPVADPRAGAEADLPNAVALNSIQFNLGRVSARSSPGQRSPSLGRMLGQSVGSAICFAINGLSFLAVDHRAADAARRPDHAGSAQGPARRSCGAGSATCAPTRPLMTLTALAFLATFLGVPLLTFLPVIARDVFGRGVDLYSEMLVASGAGAVTGALVVAWLGRFRRMGRTMLVVAGGVRRAGRRRSPSPRPSG